MDKRMFKKEGKELQEYLKSMRRHNAIPPKKGKGAKYNRAKQKGSNENE